MPSLQRLALSLPQYSTVRPPAQAQRALRSGNRSALRSSSPPARRSFSRSRSVCNSLAHSLLRCSPLCAQRRVGSPPPIMPTDHLHARPVVRRGAAASLLAIVPFDGRPGGHNVLLRGGCVRYELYPGRYPILTDLNRPS